MRYTQSLNGTWTRIADADGSGRRQGWHEPGSAPAGQSVVIPEQGAAPLPSPAGAWWFHRTFELPSDVKNRALRLNAASAGYRSEWWLNGKPVGVHDGGFLPFTLDLTHAIQSGENHIAVCIDNADGAGYRSLPPFGASIDDSLPQVQHGLGGSAAIEAVSTAHLTDVFVRPDLCRTRITVNVTATGGDSVRLRVPALDAAIDAPLGQVLLELPAFELWTPDAPHTYGLECELMSDGTIVDRLSVVFGMRECTFRDHRFFLNNHPLLLRGVRLEPAAYVSRPDEYLRGLLENARSQGFNLIWTDNAPPTGALLEFCDELGLLVFAETALGRAPGFAWNVDRCAAEAGAAVRTFRNHPSLAAWIIAGTLGGYTAGEAGRAAQIAFETATTLRDMDPSRIIVDCGAPAVKAGQFAQYFRPYHDKSEPIDLALAFWSAPSDHDMPVELRVCGSPGMPSLLAGFGCGSVPLGGSDDGASASALEDAMAARGLERLFPSVTDLVAAVETVQAGEVSRQIDALRANDRLAGYCYAGLVDSPSGPAVGLHHHSGGPKRAAKAVMEAQRSMRPLIQMATTNLSPRDEVDVVVRIANDARLEGQFDLSLQVVGPTNQVLWKKKRGFRLSRSKREVWTGRVAASGSTGPHRFVVRLMQGMSVVGQNEVNFNVIERPPATEMPVSLIDPGQLYRARIVKWARVQDAGALIYIVPPLANTIRAYPENEMSRMLAAVHEGAVGVFFQPPDDWNDLAERLDSGVEATSRGAGPAPDGVFHFVKLHPVYDGLPSRCLMDWPYRGLVPSKVFDETGDEDICGALDTRALRLGDVNAAWRNGLLVRRYGSGRLVFTHMPVLEHLGADPVAERLFVNLLNHFGRRSIPSEDPERATAAALQWLKAQRPSTRLWRVLGLFPNADGRAFDEALAPEHQVALDDPYPGRSGPIRWKAWHTVEHLQPHVDVMTALFGSQAQVHAYNRGIAYAYAEFASERRQTANVTLSHQCPARLWINGRLVAENTGWHDEETATHAEVTLRQGRNSVLIKLSKDIALPRFKFELASNTRDPLRVSWWR